MLIFESLSEFINWRAKTPKSYGFVPTMGALHQGHASLIEAARKQDLSVIVSVFVNPTQFNDPNDLKNYPRPLERDLELVKNLGVEAVLLPNYNELYSDQYRFQLRELVESKILCGRSRSGHFDGVLTVVMKLLQIVKPKKAFFGEKDYQQLRLITQMAKAFFLDCEIVGCPTVREETGLALSSRNLLLSPQDREKAALFFKVLSTAKNVIEAQKTLEQVGFRVDYVEENWGRRLGAVYLNNVRLIDNVPLS